MPILNLIEQPPLRADTASIVGERDRGRTKNRRWLLSPEGTARKNQSKDARDKREYFHRFIEPSRAEPSRTVSKLTASSRAFVPRFVSVILDRREFFSLFSLRRFSFSVRSCCSDA